MLVRRFVGSRMASERLIEISRGGEEGDMPQSIYDAIGGASAVHAAVDLFYEKVWSDPDLVPYFEGVDRNKLKRHQRAFMSAALGGPREDAGRKISTAHRGRGITNDAFDRVVQKLADTLQELGVRSELIDRIAGTLAPLRSDIVQGTIA
jgi:hemoglobin